MGSSCKLEEKFKKKKQKNLRSGLKVKLYNEIWTSNIGIFHLLSV